MNRGKGQGQSFPSKTLKETGRASSETDGEIEETASVVSQYH
ncbi:hypothetical protein [Caballeronia fortuita]|nr:hypothetical protein [Caballeronia fortuita]